VRLDRLVVQAFRGYPGRVEIVTAGELVLLHGSNGSGKTSLTEAFEWALYGTVVRRRRSKTPGEYRGWSWLRSAHADEDVPTLVEAELRSATGDRYIIRRELVGREPILTINGTPAADISAIGLRTEEAFRPFLGQCEIQALIDSSQVDRWQQLSAILGFGGFSEMRLRLQRMRTDLYHDPRVEAIRERTRIAVRPLRQPGEDHRAAYGPGRSRHDPEGRQGM
jgi:DNA repair exonuclease SbcCD ATPase subunit